MYEVGKKYLTRDGRDARVICVDRVGEKPIIALVTLSKDVGEEAYRFYANGSRFNVGTDSFDLMPPMKERWANIYPNGLDGWYDTESEAVEYRHAGCIACKKIEYYEGEGL